MAAIHVYNRYVYCTVAAEACAALRLALTSASVLRSALEVLETEPHAPSSSSPLSGPASPKSSEASSSASSPPPAASSSDRQQLLEARLRCHLNLAAAQQHARAYDAALRSLDLVLTHQPENVKALYRCAVRAGVGLFRSS